MGFKFDPFEGRIKQVGVTEQELAAELQRERGEIETSLGQELQAAVQRVEGTASVATTASVTLTAGSTGPVAVSLADPEFLGTETSIKGLLGTIYGVLERAADGSYSFTSEQTYTGAVTLGSGTIFAAAHLPNTLNPLRVGEAELQEQPAYGVSGYLYALLDKEGHIAWGVKADGSIVINAGTFTGHLTGDVDADEIRVNKLIAPGGTIDLDSADTQLLNILEGGTQTGNTAYGVFYASVVVDANNRVSYGVRPDGSVKFAKQIDGEILRAAQSSKLKTTAGDEIDHTSIYNAYAFVEVDGNNRISRAVKHDGGQYIPKLNADALTVDSLTVLGDLTAPGREAVAVVAADDTALYESRLVGNDFHIFKNALGQETQLTSTGSNYNVNLTGESPQRLIFISTRNGTARLTVMNKDGSAIALAAAPKVYAMWGDSMTGNLRSLIPNNGHTVVTQAFLDKGLTTLGNERRLVNVGIGSQTAIQIAARQGGLATTCQVTGGSIPASGSVGLTAVYPDLLYNPTLDGRLNNFPATINGVSGTLTRNTSTTYTFTRSASGASVTASGTVTIRPNTADASPIISVDLFAPSAFNGANLNEYTAIFWLGHNGVGDSGAVTGPNGETLLSLIQGCVAQLRNLSKRFLILPVFNATAASGSAAYLSAQTNYWTPLATAFPNNYYDIRRDFIDNAKTWMQTNYPSQYASDWGQAFIPSRASAGSDSDYDISNDMIPRALRADTVHLNDMGSDLFAELLAAKLLSLGW